MAASENARERSHIELMSLRQEFESFEMEMGFSPKYLPRGSRRHELRLALPGTLANEVGLLRQYISYEPLTIHNVFHIAHKIVQAKVMFPIFLNLLTTNY